MLYDGLIGLENNLEILKGVLGLKGPVRIKRTIVSTAVSNTGDVGRVGVGVGWGDILRSS